MSKAHAERKIISILPMLKRRKDKKADTMKRPPGHKISFSLLAIVILLCGIGLVMIASSGMYAGYEDFDNSLYFFNRQLRWFIFGALVMLGAMLIKIDWYKKGALLVYVIVLLLQIAVFFFGVILNGSRRWLSIAGFQFQPSELAKIGISISLAALLSSPKCHLNERWGYWIPFLGLMLVAGLVSFSNLSNAIIIGFIGMMMLIAAGAPWKKLSLSFGIIILGVIVLLIFPLIFPEVEIPFLSDLLYRSERIKAFLHPELYADSSSYQVIQSKYAIALGGFLGVGIGNGIQKLGYIPEAYNDIIFAVIVEETGFVGAAVIIGLFCLLILKCISIANHAPNDFMRLLVLGLTVQIASQVIINIAVNTGVFPVTGVTLPFISYGGSSLIFLMGSIGIILNVSRYTRETEKPESKNVRSSVRKEGQADEIR